VQANTAKQELILDAKRQHPELSTRELAKVCQTDHTYVSKVLKTYKISNKTLKDYKDSKADIWQGISARLLSKLSDAQIQKATALQLVTAAGICESKYTEMSGGKPDVIPMVVINSLTVNPVEGSSQPAQIIDLNNAEKL
jgi:hypothetical protein